MPIPKSNLAVAVLAILALTPCVPRSEVCHTSEEAQADAGLRYQAHLRVIALSCTPAASGGSLYTQYQTFIGRNQDILEEYQTRLLHYYKTHGKGDPEARMRTRDTEINNDESLAAARSSISAFCRVHVPDLQRAATESPQDVRHDIETIDGAQSASQRKCR